MTAWIFNASPLILLGKIHRLDLLQVLPPSFLVPAAVHSEILAGPDQDPAKNWLQNRESSVQIVPDVPAPPAILGWDLGSGETSVISLALANQGFVCVLDDRAARNCAQVFGVPVMGTVGVLLKARLAGLIPELRPEIDNLLAVGSLLSPTVIQRALALAGESGGA